MTVDAFPGTRARLALASGVLQAVAHARIEAALCTILAAVVLALAVDGARPRVGAGCGLIFGVVVALGFAPQASAAWMVLVALLCFAVLCAGMGLVGALCTGTDRPPVLAALGLPFVAWLYETLNGLGPLGDYLGLAAAVVGLPPLVALARWGGPGVTAAAAVGIGVAMAYIWTRARRRTMGIALAGWLILAGTAATQPLPGPTVVVAAVVPAPATTPSITLGALTQGTAQAAEQGAQLVVWPEALLRVNGLPGGGDPTWRHIRAAARRAGVPVIAGVFVRDLDENLAVLVRADGSIGPTYSKNRLIPGMEHYTAGVLPPEPWDVAGVPVAVGAVICFDDCFAGGPQRLSREGAGLLAVPTRDWPEVQHRHRRLSILRAAQAGLPLVRAASGGISQIISASGRVLAEAPAPTLTTVVLVAPVRVARGAGTPVP